MWAFLQKHPTAQELAIEKAKKRHDESVDAASKELDELDRVLAALARAKGAKDD
jgi:hypothetical protein